MCVLMMACVRDNVNLYEYNQVNLHAVVSVPIIMRS